MSRVHFGSLEHVAGITSDTNMDATELIGETTLDALKDHTVMRAQAEDLRIQQSLESKRLAFNIHIPTNNEKVKMALRALNEPITLFAEGNGDRRNRLRELVVQLQMDGKDVQHLFQDDEQNVPQDDIKEEFFTYGPSELTQCKREILKYSIPRAVKRLEEHRQELKIPFVERKKIRHEFYTNLQGYEAKALQFGDDRPLGFCSFAPNSKILATTSWTGLVKLWNVPECEQIQSFRGHKDRVSGIAWHPESTIGQSSSALNFASGATDGTVNLWSLDSDLPIGSLVGHEMRVARLAFHPSGRFIGTASFDTSWRLWDAETTQELLLQEGHSREVFAIGFQKDGALCATAGLDSIGRIWDLRSGRSIMVLRSHVKPILSLDWSPCGYQLATAGEDNQIKIWDIRKMECIYSIPAHTNIISSVRYWNATNAFDSNCNHSSMDVDESHPDVHLPSVRRQQLDGSFLISSSYDGTCRLWTDGDYKPIKSLSGLEGKVMCADVSGDAKYIVTALYDRTFKLFGIDIV